MEVQTKKKVSRKKTDKQSPEDRVKVRGHVKDLLRSDAPGILLMHLKDEKGGGQDEQNQPSGKAFYAGEISSRLFTYLNEFRIPTHFLERVSATESRVRELSMIPLSVTAWNVADAEFGARFGLREAHELPVPVLEHRWKRNSGMQLINEFHMYSLGIVTPEQYRSVNRIASKANIVLRSFFERRGLKLVSAAFEFGIQDGQVMIGDEISPRTCRFRDVVQQSFRRPQIDCTKSTAAVFRQLHDRILAR